MKRNHLTAALLSLLCAAALTACGSDPIEPDTAEVTTATTDTTEATGTETTAGTDTATTADTKGTTDTNTTAADESTTESTDTATTAAEEATTAAAEQTTEAPAAQQTEAPATEAPQKEENIFDALKIGGSCADYIAKHTNYQMTEQDSCLVVGKDRAYTYPDFILNTVVENGVEKIHSIELTTGNISTRKGIHIGSTAADVTNAYGAAADGEYIYNTEDGEIEFTVANDAVTSIYLH